MIKIIGLIVFGMMPGTTLLASWQSFSSDLDKLNSGLSKLTGQQAPTATADSSVATSKKQIKNIWNVSNKQAMAWLAQDDSTWSDGKKLKDVNWYTFWSQQIHYRTDLAKKAQQYCERKPWDAAKIGANCQTYFEATTTTKSAEAREMGEKMAEVG